MFLLELDYLPGIHLQLNYPSLPSIDRQIPRTIPTWTPFIFYLINQLTIFINQVIYLNISGKKLLSYIENYFKRNSGLLA
jgi:hypothetical protein